MPCNAARPPIPDPCSCASSASLPTQKRCPAGYHRVHIAFRCPAALPAPRSPTPDPWGSLRASSGSMPTQKSFTGQYLDGTGLLFYHARYYDPGLGRFVSADSIVPGNASGGMDGIAYKPLTVDLHEPGFVAAVNRENQFGPWYTLSDEERQELGSPWGPQNPQALNRYTYVQNNPLKWTDPGGHVPPPCVYCNAPWFNIRDWHPMAQGVVVVGCFIVGCTIDKAGTVIGPGAKSMVTSIGIMGVSSKVLQTGGNTIRGSTANALNKAHGLRLQPREWGRALEELKKDFLLANDHHGKILESGNYIDAKTGEVLGNILDYLP